MASEIDNSMYSKVTNEVKVSVVPVYLDEHSDPSEDHYVWAYTVQVENLSDRKIQLLNRHWVITDGTGHIQEVQGEGVVGEKPTLHPGEGFRYTSGTSLATPTGVMVGSYEMRDEFGRTFPIEVPLFSLDSPYQRVRPN